LINFEVILIVTNFCSGSKPPSRDHANFLGKFLWRLSEKTANWIGKIIDASELAVKGRTSFDEILADAYPLDPEMLKKNSVESLVELIYENSKIITPPKSDDSSVIIVNMLHTPISSSPKRHSRFIRREISSDNPPQEPTQGILQKVDTQEKVISELNKSLGEKSPRRSTKSVQDFIGLLNDTATPSIEKKPSKLESVFKDMIDLSQTFVELLNESKTERASKKKSDVLSNSGSRSIRKEDFQIKQSMAEFQKLQSQNINFYRPTQSFHKQTRPSTAPASHQYFRPVQDFDELEDHDVPEKFLGEEMLDDSCGDLKVGLREVQNQEKETNNWRYYSVGRYGPNSHPKAVPMAVRREDQSHCQATVLGVRSIPTAELGTSFGQPSTGSVKFAVNKNCQDEDALVMKHISVFDLRERFENMARECPCLADASNLDVSNRKTYNVQHLNRPLAEMVSFMTNYQNFKFEFLTVFSANPRGWTTN
jgi:hypothetical protein